jgi:hypothetical protein
MIGGLDLEKVYQAEIARLTASDRRPPADRLREVCQTKGLTPVGYAKEWAGKGNPAMTALFLDLPEVADSVAIGERARLLASAFERWADDAEGLSEEVLAHPEEAMPRAVEQARESLRMVEAKRPIINVLRGL